MKAIVISSYGGPEVLTVTELPDPVPAADEVLIAVRAFGLNHAEAGNGRTSGSATALASCDRTSTPVADRSLLRRFNSWKPKAE